MLRHLIHLPNRLSNLSDPYTVLLSRCRNFCHRRMYLIHLAIYTVQILHEVFNHVGRVLGCFGTAHRQIPHFHRLSRTGLIRGPLD